MNQIWVFQDVYKRQTLMELMIVVAIIGILAGIAYPTYQDSVRKSRRADAEAVLLELAQWMERFYTENNRYDQTRAGVAVALPFAQSPKEGGPAGGYYTIAVAAPQPNTFTPVSYTHLDVYKRQVLGLTTAWRFKARRRPARWLRSREPSPTRIFKRGGTR